jgi:hypothetical protein
MAIVLEKGASAGIVLGADQDTEALARPVVGDRGNLMV